VYLTKRNIIEVSLSVGHAVMARIHMNNRLIVGIAFSLAVQALCLGQTAPPKLVFLPKDPPKAILKSTPLGAKPGTDILHLSLSLKPADPNGFQKFVDSVSDPKSANYHHFISPEEVGRAFGLTPSKLQTVKDYLAAQGMTIRLVSKNRHTGQRDCHCGLVDATQG